MKIIDVIVNEKPESCGDCSLMFCRNNQYICSVLPTEKYEIVGNPYAMTYRRSDCPLSACIEPN